MLSSLMMKLWQEKSYTLANIDDESSNHKEDAVVLEQICKRSRPRISRLTISTYRSLLYQIGILLITVFLTERVIRWADHASGRTLIESSFYSPFLKTVSVGPLTTRRIDGALFPNASNPSHIFRMPPSPAVDAAWDRIASPKINGITTEQLLQLGKEPTFVVKAPEKWKLEASPYFADLDVFHQIHCLNQIRKGLVSNYDYYYGEHGKKPSPMLPTHLNHCLSIILQNIMCHADVDPVTYVWREGFRKPFPDFDINKKCRDFNALLEWQEKVALKDNIRAWKDIEKPDDVVQLPPLSEMAGLMDGMDE